MDHPWIPRGTAVVFRLLLVQRPCPSRVLWQPSPITARLRRTADPNLFFFVLFLCLCLFLFDPELSTVMF